MATDDWFWAWTDRHIERFPRGDWPAPDTGFWVEFRHLLITSGATEDVADEASRRLFADPPEFVGDHPKALREAIRLVFRDSRARTIPIRPGPPPDDHAAFDAAAAAKWARLGEEERGEWRRMVRERCPYFAKQAKSVELVAQAWALDPSWVIPVPEPRHDPAPSSRRGPRHVLDPVPFPPKGS